MINVDTPGFPIALLAILVGLRLAVYAIEHFAEEPVTEPAALPPQQPEPDAGVDMAPDVDMAPSADMVSDTGALPEAKPVAEGPEAAPAAELPEDSAPTVLPEEPPAGEPAPADKFITPLTPLAAETLAIAETPAAAQPTAVAVPPAERRYGFLYEILDSGIVAVILVFFLIRPFILQAFFIPSGSMIPTLREGDKLLATKYTYHLREPRRGEIVVFHAPQQALKMANQVYDPKQPVDYVKRVIGLPGDHIRIVQDAGVYVNDVKLKEPNISLPDYNFPVQPDGSLGLMDSSVYQQLSRYIEGDELVVPKGYLFVLGDNRTLSHDSHKWGFLSRKALVGKAFFIFWPPNRVGPVK